MRPAQVIEIETPTNILLNGLWFGARKPKRAIIWIHGLASSAFSKLDIVEGLANSQTAVITFNNRGYGGSNRLRRYNPKKKECEYVQGGAAHEVFEECVDDIDGAIAYAKRQGAREIFLAGHSTGCQKSVYYATRKGKTVAGIILLAPISDYAAALHFDRTHKVLKRQARQARTLMQQKKPHALVPGSWLDAQRFLSLNTPESVEEIFTYAQQHAVPTIYHALKVPTLVLFPEDDEYKDRPVADIGAWFVREARMACTLQIITGTNHGFEGKEKETAHAIRTWLRRV